MTMWKGGSKKKLENIAKILTNLFVNSNASQQNSWAAECNCRCCICFKTTSIPPCVFDALRNLRLLATLFYRSHFHFLKKKRKKNLTLDPNQLKCKILYGYATKGLFVIYTFIIIHLLPQHGTIHGDFAKIWEQILLWLHQSRLPPLLKMLYVDWVSVDLNLTSRVFSGHSSFLPPQNRLPVYSIWLSP